MEEKYNIRFVQRRKFGDLIESIARFTPLEKGKQIDVLESRELCKYIRELLPKNNKYTISFLPCNNYQSLLVNLTAHESELARSSHKVEEEELDSILNYFLI